MTEEKRPSQDGRFFSGLLSWKSRFGQFRSTEVAISFATSRLSIDNLLVAHLNCINEFRKRSEEEKNEPPGGNVKKATPARK